MLKFIPLTHSHLPLLVLWLNQPHVQQWYSHGNTKPISLDTITKKIAPRIEGTEEVHGYILEYNQKSIGYIQVYDARKFPRDGYELAAVKKHIAHIPKLAAIDLYIGDPAYIGKGLGSQIIKQFVHDIVAKSYNACLANPDVKNIASIRAFVKAGFEEVAEVALDNGEQVKIMLLEFAKSKETFDDAVKSLCTQWQLQIRTIITTPPFNNYVAITYSKKYHKEVILKVLIHDTHEIAALKVFNGNGCVALLDYDQEYKAFIIEYIQPGTSLKSFFPEQDDQATIIAAEVIKKLQLQDHLNQTKGFKTVADWLKVLHTTDDNRIPKQLLLRAQELSTTLTSNMKLYFLHGDIHHENILKNGNDWIAIDPKGVLGPLEYEIGRFIMNPKPDLLEQPNAKDIIIQRIQIFTTLFGFDKQRVIDWLFVQAILSTCWAEKDDSEESFNYFLKFAQLIDEISQ